MFYLADFALQPVQPLICGIALIISQRTRLIDEAIKSKSSHAMLRNITIKQPIAMARTIGQKQIYFSGKFGQ